MGCAGAFRRGAIQPWAGEAMGRWEANDIEAHAWMGWLLQAMDIQVSSNFERYLYTLCGHDAAKLAELISKFHSSVRPWAAASATPLSRLWAAASATHSSQTGWGPVADNDP